MLHLLLFAALLLASCGYAIARGGAPERIVGVALLVAAVASSLSPSILSQRFYQIELGVFGVDTALLVILVAVALFADRGWPLIVAGLQLCAVGAHLVKLVDVNMIRVTYVLSITIWSYPMLVALAYGTWKHERRMRERGYDLSWTQRTLSPAGPA